MIPAIVVGIEAAMGRSISEKEVFSKALVDFVTSYGVEKIHVERGKLS